MRKTKSNLLILSTALTLTLFCAQGNAALQPAKQAQGEAATKKNEASNPSNYNYKVSYMLNEVENGKTINSRTYTLMAGLGPTATIRIGSRIPYSTGGNQFGPIQYQDVGMNIDCKLGNFGEEGKLIVHTKVDMSSLQGNGTETPSQSNPVFGQFQVESFTVATLGKPAFVGSADDVNSNRRFVIEVTVTRPE